MRRSNVASTRDQFFGDYFWFMYMTSVMHQIYWIPIRLQMTLTFFLSHQNINTIFKIFNEELKKIGIRLKSNKLSPKTKKTNYTISHKKSFKDDLSLKLAALKAVKSFLGVMLRENIYRKEHIHTVKTKLAKNIGLLKKNVLKAFILHVFIHICITLILHKPVPIELN